jgi:hypothetical protein
MDKSEIEKIHEEMVRDIREARIREWDKRDEAFLTITAGSLALSVTFLTISGLNTVINPSVLFWSWSFLSVSIIFQLASYISVDHHFVAMEEVLDNWLKEGEILKISHFQFVPWERITLVFNYASYILTLLGLILLVIFGWYNLSAMAKEGKKFANPIVPTALPVPAQPSSPTPAVTPAPVPPSKG